jgi:hypothetical protein
MRSYGKMAIALCTGVAAVGLVVGQQPGGGFQRGGRAGATDPAALLQNESVRKELKLTDEQMQKVPDAVLKALGTVLEPAQLKRLKEITLQIRGYKALTDPNVQTALKLTDEQKDSVKTIVSDSDKEMQELVKEMRGGAGGKGGFEKVLTLRKEAQEKAMGVLNANQKKEWKEMTGEEFKMEPQGGGFRGKKGKKNKTDA